MEKKCDITYEKSQVYSLIMLRNQYTPPLQSSEIGKPNIDSSKNKTAL